MTGHVGFDSRVLRGVFQEVSRVGRVSVSGCRIQTIVGRRRGGSCAAASPIGCDLRLLLSFYVYVQNVANGPPTVDHRVAAGSGYPLPPMFFTSVDSKG